MVLSLFLARIVYGLIVGIGFILLIFPAFYWGAMFSQYRYCIIEKRLGPIGGLKRSKELTSPEGIKGKLVVLFFIVFGLIILGIIPCFIGLFLIIPTIWMADAFVYRRLSPAPPINELLISGDNDKNEL